MIIYSCFCLSESQDCSRECVCRKNFWMARLWKLIVQSCALLFSLWFYCPIWVHLLQQSQIDGGLRAPESRCQLAKAFKTCSRRRNILQNGNTNCRLTQLQVSVSSLYSAAVWYNKSLQVSRTNWQLKHGWWAQLFPWQRHRHCG